MADATLGVEESGSPTHLIDNEELTVGGDSVLRQRIRIAGLSDTDLAPVDSTMGLKTDPIEPVATATLSNVSASLTVVTLSASNANRMGLWVFNDSDDTCYVKMGSAASLTSFSFALGGNEFWELPTRPVYTGIVTAIWYDDSASPSVEGAARVTEF